MGDIQMVGIIELRDICSYKARENKCVRRETLNSFNQIS